MLKISGPKLNASELAKECSKKELKQCINLSKKSKRLGYAAVGMNSASSAMMLSTGQTGFVIAGALLGLAALIGIYTNYGMNKFNNAANEAYKLKTNA